MSSVVTRAVEMTHERDPKEEIKHKAGAFLDEFRIGGCDVLVALYMRPEKTKSGIILADKTRDEDRHQGTVGLVVQLGPLAFSTERGTDKWFSPPPRVGDWVVFNVREPGVPILIGSQPCRLVEDKYLRAVVARPDSVM